MSDTLNEASRAFTDVHLTEEFFAKALSHGLGEPISVGSLLLTAGSAMGDNFCSDIYRAVVNYRTIAADAAAPPTRISLIVKCLPTEDARGVLMQDLAVFKKEVNMYLETLPRMSALLGGERLSARCYYAQSDPVQIIVFEDLKVADFRMTDRVAGIDVAHCELVVKKLARFHAASVRLHEQKPDAMRLYTYGMFKPKAKLLELVHTLFQKGLGQVIEVMRTWPGYEGTVAKLEKIEVRRARIGGDRLFY